MTDTKTVMYIKFKQSPAGFLGYGIIGCVRTTTDDLIILYDCVNVYELLTRDGRFIRNLQSDALISDGEFSVWTEQISMCREVLPTDALFNEYKQSQKLYQAEKAGIILTDDKNEVQGAFHV